MSVLAYELIILFSLFIGSAVALLGMLGYAIINKWRDKNR